jgi:hypothetical protein
MNSLPYELFVTIIEHLALDEKESLKNCSLVTKSWTYPCQKHLFESILCRSRKGLELWLDVVSGKGARLLKHVRKLTCKFQEFGTFFDSRFLLPELEQLRHFEFTMGVIWLAPRDVEVFFASFKHSLSAITLAMCGISKATLVTLIQHFPRLQYLSLQWVEEIRCNEESPCVSSPPLKKLFVYDDNGDSSGHFMGLLKGLSELGLRFEEIVLSENQSFFLRVPVEEFANGIVSAFGDSVQCLRLPWTLYGLCDLSFHYLLRGPLVISLS